MVTRAIISKLCDFEMELQAALDARGLLVDASQTKFERGYSVAVRRELIDLIHKVATLSMPIGGAQEI